MKMDAQVLVAVVTGVVFVALVFRRWLWKGAKVLGRMACGGALLWGLGQLGLVHLGINLVNLVVIGLLGLPGVGLLWALSSLVA